MKKNKIQGIWIRDKDKELFKYLHQVKSATVSQINRDIYHYDKIKSLYKRLDDFQDLGLVITYYHYELPKKKIMSLTEVGFKKFVADGTERIIELKSQSVIHDLALVDIRHRLKCSKKITGFFTENELKSWNSHRKFEELNRFIDIRCDGAIEAKLSKGNVYFAVEYEATRKSLDRVDEIIAKYYKNVDIPAVLYVCSSDEVRKLFATQERKFLQSQATKEDNKFFYKLFEDLMTDRLMVFTDAAENKLQLGEKTQGRTVVEHSTEYQGQVSA